MPPSTLCRLTRYSAAIDHAIATGDWSQVPDDAKLDTAQAAAYLTMQPASLEVFRCTGRHGIPYLKLGRLVRYVLRDLRAWEARRRVDAPSDDEMRDEGCAR